MKTSAPQQSKAFTLVELVIVILLIGILSAVAVPRIFKSFDKAHDAVVSKFSAELISGIKVLRADWLATGTPRPFFVDNTAVQLNRNGIPTGLVQTPDEDQQYQFCHFLAQNVTGYPESLFVEHRDLSALDEADQEFVKDQHTWMIALDSYQCVNEPTTTTTPQCHFVYLEDQSTTRLVQYDASKRSPTKICQGEKKPPTTTTTNADPFDTPLLTADSQILTPHGWSSSDIGGATQKNTFSVREGQAMSSSISGTVRTVFSEVNVPLDADIFDQISVTTIHDTSESSTSKIDTGIMSYHWPNSAQMLLLTDRHKTGGNGGKISGIVDIQYFEPPSALYETNTDGEIIAITQIPKQLSINAAPFTPAKIIKTDATDQGLLLTVTSGGSTIPVREISITETKEEINGVKSTVRTVTVDQDEPVSLVFDDHFALQGYLDSDQIKSIDEISSPGIDDYILFMMMTAHHTPDGTDKDAIEDANAAMIDAITKGVSNIEN